MAKCNLSHNLVYQKYSQAALSFISDYQEEDGHFLLYSVQTSHESKPARRSRTPFLTALILSCVAEVPNITRHTTFVRNALQGLKKEFSSEGAVNYWLRGTEESKEVPYPDDLDDTFCALQAVAAWDTSFLSGKVMANVVRILTAVEVQEAGPYRTWLVSPDAGDEWQDVDPVVNANVAYFLVNQEIELDGLDDYLENCVLEGEYASQYYAGMIPVLYFVARSYKGSHKSMIIESIWDIYDDDNGWGNQLHNALMITALYRLGESADVLEIMVEKYLLQEPTWYTCPFVTDVAEGLVSSKPTYVGSPALTAAFCLEAVTEVCGSSEQVKLSSKSDFAYEAVRAYVELEVSSLPEPLRTEVGLLTQAVFENDSTNEVALLPFWCCASLRDRLDIHISKEDLIQLGSASIFGWAAYTIYDDFFDDEGDRQLLSAANTCLRAMQSLFTQYASRSLGGSAFCQYISDVLGLVDNATSWELTHCRFDPSTPHFSTLDSVSREDFLSQMANKSLGHALSTVGVLCTVEAGMNDENIHELITYFRHYLTARQINDDMHDWEQDLAAGQLNTVNVLLMNPTHLGTSRGPEELRSLFWTSVVDDACAEVMDHVRLGRQSLARIDAIDNPHHFAALLTNMENVAIQTLKGKQDTHEFLEGLKMSEE